MPYKPVPRRLIRDMVRPYLFLKRDWGLERMSAKGFKTIPTALKQPKRA